MTEHDSQSDAQSDQSRNGHGGSGLLSTLASKELLVPAVLGAAGTVAASKGPDLVRRLTGSDKAERLGESAAAGAKNALSGAGSGAAGLAGKAAGALGKGGGGRKKTRRLPIERWTDVAVPVAKAYDAWTRFDDYPRFMHRVLNVQQRDDDRVRWQEKIWFSTREWEGRITDRRRNDRIAWKTTGGMSHSGVVSFHELADNLTRVMVTMEFEPNGIMEKMASGLRFVKRAVEADLARFKAFVEMEDAEGLQYRPTSGGESRQRSSANRNGKSDEERDAGRKERESRRERRRERAGAR